MEVDDTATSISNADVLISDTTLKEQANVQRLPQTDTIDNLISQLKAENEACVLVACNSLAYRIFIPWLNKQNQVNKLYFAKKGGIKLCVQWMNNESIDLGTRIAAGTAVWNFAESGPMYEILWKEGAVQALLKFLDSDFQLQRVAIGALFGLLDYDPIYHTHFPIELVGKVLSVRKHHGEDWALNLGKAGCLVCLAKNDLTRVELLRLEAFRELSIDQNDIFLNYLHAISLAHMTVDESEFITSEEREEILKKISEQFQHSPQSIRVRERECGVVWKSVHHFKSEKETKKRKNVKRNKMECGVVWKSFHHFKRILKSSNEILCKFGLFCIANLSYGDYNRTIFDQELLGYLVCLQWKYKDFKDFFSIIFSNFEVQPFPSLSTICQFHGARLPEES